MRQRSVTGPLILIAVGVLFLLHEFAPDVNFRILRDFWPIAIIGVGLLGLIEVLYHASRGNPIPPRPISGWVWVLVVFGALGTWSYRRGNVHIGQFEAGGVSLLGTSYDYAVDAHSNTDGVTLVVLENLRGNVSLQGTDDERVTVTGHRTVRAYNKSDADKANAGSVKLERHGETLLIHADVTDTRPALEVSGDLEILVPRKVNVEVSNTRGDIRVADISRDVKVNTKRSSLVRISNVKGKLNLNGSGEDVQVESIGGAVNVNGQFAGTLEFRSLGQPLHFTSDITDMRVEAVPGSVTLDLSDLRMKGVTGPVRFTTKSRDVQIEDATNLVEVALERGDVQLDANQTPPKMDVHTQRGNIDLTLPEKAAFELKATTEQGEVENDFGEALMTSASGRSASAKGSVGKGPGLVLVTDRGTISIKKK